MCKFISRSVAFLFVLSIAGVASARRPPALERAQAEADSVYATCGDSGRETAGYRDMRARVANAKSAVSPVAAASVAPVKMGDHLVLVCAGGEIHAGSGYRDFPARLYSEPSSPQIARAASLAGVH